MQKLPITVVMLTLNEEHNLPGMLDNILPWVQKVYMVDSLSTDQTVSIALGRGVQVAQRAFTNFSDQWNWALECLEITTPWILKLDPDERVPDALWQEIQRTIALESPLDGYSINFQLWFMGKPTRQKLRVSRLWRTGRCRFTGVLVNEHPVVQTKLGRLKEVAQHHDSQTLHHWFEKQNFYSTICAIELAQNMPYVVEPKFWGNTLQRRMFFKKIYYRLPCRTFLYYLYLLIIKGALLDGYHGRAWARLRVQFMGWIVYKTWEIRTTGQVPQLPKLKHGDYDPRVTACAFHNKAHEQHKSP